MHQPPDPLERDLVELFHGTPAEAEPVVADTAARAATARRRRRDLGTALGSGLAVAALVGGLYAVPQLANVGRVGGGPIAVGSSGEASPSSSSSEESPSPTVLPSAVPDAPTANPTPTFDPASLPAIPSTVLPSLAELGAELDTRGFTTTQAVGAAPLMGMQICDTFVRAGELGAADAAVVSPTHGGSTGGWRSAWPQASSDVTINVFASGRAAVAFEQLKANAGFCLWFPTTPEPRDWTGHPDTLNVVSGPNADLFIGGSLERVGDVLVGATARRGSPEDALAEAQRIVTLTVDRVRAAMPEAKG